MFLTFFALLCIFSWIYGFLVKPALRALLGGEEDLKLKTVPKLRGLCRDLGLPADGNKPDLVARLQAHAAATEATAAPSPTTHAIFRQLKAGESMYHTSLSTKTVFHAPRGAQPLLHALYPPST